MSRYKKLKPLSIYHDDDLYGLKETDIVFSKEGWYLDRILKKSWYEIKTSTGIRAFESRVTDFNWSLELALHRPLTTKESDSVKAVLRFTKNKDLKNLYYVDCHWKQLRNTHRETKKWLVGFKSKGLE